MSLPGTADRVPDRPRIPIRRLLAGCVAAWVAAVVVAFVFGVLFELVMLSDAPGSQGGAHPVDLLMVGGFYVAFAAVEGVLALPLIGLPILLPAARLGPGRVRRWVLSGLGLSLLLLLAQTLIGALVMGQGVISLDFFAAPAVMIAGPLAALVFRATIFAGS